MPGSNTLPFLRVIDGQDSNRPGGSSSVSLGSAQVSSGFLVPASKSRSLSGSTHLFLTFAHGVCASSAGPFLADAPSLVSKAEVSGPRQEGLRGHSPSGPEQLLVGCSAEEILLPRLPRLLSTSLLCRQVLAPPLYLIALRKSGGMVPHGAGADTSLLLSARRHFLSLRGSKKQNTRTGLPSCLLFTCEASSRTADGFPPD